MACGNERGVRRPVARRGLGCAGVSLRCRGPGVSRAAALFQYRDAPLSLHVSDVVHPGTQTDLIRERPDLLRVNAHTLFSVAKLASACWYQTALIREIMDFVRMRTDWSVPNVDRTSADRVPMPDDLADLHLHQKRPPLGSLALRSTGRTPAPSIASPRAARNTRLAPDPTAARCKPRMTRTPGGSRWDLSRS